MGCYHGLVPWGVTMEFYHRLLPWIVTMDCYHGLLPWIVTMDCYHHRTRCNFIYIIIIKLRNTWVVAQGHETPC